jgi:hypothetical protein
MLWGNFHSKPNLKSVQFSGGCMFLAHQLIQQINATNARQIVTNWLGNV